MNYSAFFSFTCFLYFRVGFLALVRLAKLALYTLGHLFDILASVGTEMTLDKESRYITILFRIYIEVIVKSSSFIIYDLF